MDVYSISFDDENNPYVIAFFGADYGYLSSLRWEEDIFYTWEVLDDEITVTGEKGCLEVEGNDIFIVCYNETFKDYNLIVKKYVDDEGSWENLGIVGSDPGLSSVRIKCGPDKTPYVCIKNNETTIIKKFSGGQSWTDLNCPYNNFTPSLFTVDRNNKVWVLVNVDYDNDIEPTLVKYENGEWKDVMYFNSNSDSPFGFGEIEIAENGNIFFEFSMMSPEDPMKTLFYVGKYSNGKYTEVGEFYSTHALEGDHFTYDLLIDRENMPVVMRFDSKYSSIYPRIHKHYFENE